MEMFKELTDNEGVSYRQWARDNFKSYTSPDAEKQINGAWHPVVQEECKRMREEYVLGLTLRLNGYSKEEAEEAVRKQRESYA